MAPTSTHSDRSAEGAHGVRELRSGVDALYLSGRADLSPSLFEVLEERRLAAEAADEPVPLDVAGVSPASWMGPLCEGCAT